MPNLSIIFTEIYHKSYGIKIKIWLYKFLQIKNAKLTLNSTSS